MPDRPYQAAIDPPESEWLRPDPQCLCCHGTGRIESPERGVDGYQSRICMHCCDDERPTDEDRDDARFHDDRHGGDR